MKILENYTLNDLLLNSKHLNNDIPLYITTSTKEYCIENNDNTKYDTITGFYLDGNELIFTYSFTHSLNTKTLGMLREFSQKYPQLLNARFTRDIEDGYVFQDSEFCIIKNNVIILD